MAQVLFVTPHQDDETLSMGAAIRNHLEAGHDVHVLLLTNGLGSGVQARIGMDDVAFAAARDDEYRRACRRLGVRFDNIHFADDRPRGGELTAETARAQILAWLDGRTDVWLKSYTDRLGNPSRHPDHEAAGQAAVSLLDSGAVTNLRLYVEPWTTVSGVTVSAEHAVGTAIVQAALDEYKAKDGVGGKYGIGYQSTPSYFDLVRPSPTSHYHQP
jgi:LmbE family N-acetylglucosaminyl deacetylase